MSEKTEKATPKKQRDAREKGQVGQSQDLTKLLVLMAVSEVCLGMADESMTRLQYLTALPLRRLREPFMNTLVELSGEAMWTLISFILSSVGVAILMRLVGSWLQIGILFAPKALKIDLGKLNPLSHLKQMFSGQNVLNLLLSILKAVAIGVTLYVSIKPLLGKLVLLADTDLTTYWHALLTVFRSVLRTTLGLLLALAMVDFAMQKYFHAKKLRMSHEDIKKEYKQSEGDPHVKGHRKHLAHELLNAEPSTAPRPVEDADLLLVNPTHYAVALFYRPGKTPLPVIHCKGEDEDALALIKRAKKAKIPVVQCVWLARALYKVKTGRHIPRQTLLDVARIYQVIRQLDEVSEDVIQLEEY
ncbi:type III secretion system export apparatus subunit SctU [Pseudomonas sp. SDO528_S397]